MGFGLAFCGNIILSLFMWAQKSLVSLGRNRTLQSFCSGIKAAIDVWVCSENKANTVIFYFLMEFWLLLEMELGKA